VGKGVYYYLFMSDKKPDNLPITQPQTEIDNKLTIPLQPDVKAVVEVTPKHPGGRPLIFESEEALQLKIDEYLKFVEDNSKPHTLERLACFLDCSLQTLRNYSAKDEYFGTIRKIKDIIFASKIENLNTPRANTPGIIFDVCNNRSEDYSNRHNQEKSESPQPILIFTKEVRIDRTKKLGRILSDSI
jgi:hypothetical protein